MIDLREEICVDGGVGWDVGFYDVVNDFDGIGILEDGGVLGSCLNDLILGGVWDVYEFS